MLIVIFIIITFIAFKNNLQTRVMVETFKSKAIYQEDISTSKIKYYCVESNEKTIDLLTSGDCIPGQPGDILVSTEQNTIAPIINDIISFYVGGHAGYLSGSYKDFEVSSSNNSVVESTTTNGITDNVRLFSIADWQNNKYFKSVIGLRVRMTDQERQEVTSLITSYIDDPYNTSFIFNTVNKSYCTDLITKGFDYIGKDLNEDKFVVSVFDLIVSKYTYISYYHYYDTEGIKHVYYFG